jgi:diguanylate cyclase (GGDEF)-like protein
MEGEALPVKKGTAKVTLSIGVAECPSHAESVSDVIAVADAALYEAKRKGRNRVSTGKRGSRRMTAL